MGAHYWIAKRDWAKCAEVGQPAIEVLTARLEHPDERIQRGAISTLGKIGAQSVAESLHSPIVRLLLTAVNDQRESVCDTAIQALGQVGEHLRDANLHSQVIEAINVALENRSTRATAIQALVEISIRRKIPSNTRG